MTAAWTPRRQAAAYDRVHEAIGAGRQAVGELQAGGGHRTEGLRAVAASLDERRAELREANDLDLRDARLDRGSLRRLELSDQRITELADGLRALAARPTRWPPAPTPRPARRCRAFRSAWSARYMRHSRQ